MDFETFLLERFLMPKYGKAPSWLVSEHQKAIKKMELLYLNEKSLTSEAMLKLSEQADAIAIQISSYNP